jgi:zinc finger MYM-type protein 2/3/4
MEDPQTTKEINQDGSKVESNDVEISVDDENESKSMDVDNDTTRSSIDMEVQVDETVPTEILEDDKSQDASININNESIAPEDQSNLNFTEKSINISKLDMDQHADESTDAFDALKQSESDALVTTNEEIENHLKSQEQNSENSNDGEKSMDKDVSMHSAGDNDSDHNNDNSMKDAATQDDEHTKIDEEDIPTNHDDTDFISLQNQQNEEPEKEEEGKGIDENVQLLDDDNEVIENDEDREISEKKSDNVIELSDNEDEPSSFSDEKFELPEEYEEEEETTLKENEIRQFSGENSTCLNCETEKNCPYKVLEESGEIRFICSSTCVSEHCEDNPDKYHLTSPKTPIFGMKPKDLLCCQCNDTKSCCYKVKVKTTGGDEEDSEELKYLCSKDCVTAFIGERVELYTVRELIKSVDIKEEDGIPRITARSEEQCEMAKLDREASLVRRCNQCLTLINYNKKTVSWELMDFCELNCLNQYQMSNGNSCSKCDSPVSSVNMGKLSVRFGDSVHQFCSKDCHSSFKTTFHPCSLCSRNLRDKSEVSQTFKKGSYQFCSRRCVRRFDEICHKRVNHPERPCAVCDKLQVPQIFVYIDGEVHRICSQTCFSAFKFVNNVNPDECSMCQRYFERKSINSNTYFEMTQNAQPKIFCTKECFTVFIIKNREILKCDWCKVSKYNFDLIFTELCERKICSHACEMSIEESGKSKESTSCNNCKSNKPIQYTLEMSDYSTRSFCAYQCVLTFQASFVKAKQSGQILDVVPKGTARRVLSSLPTFNKWAKPTPIIKTSYARGRGRPSKYAGPHNPTVNKPDDIPCPEIQVILERFEDIPSRAKVKKVEGKFVWEQRGPSPPPVIYEHKTQVVTIPPCPKEVRNKSTMCKSLTLNKAISCVPETSEVECQTDDWLEKRYFVPIPVPIFVPQPMHMYSLPTPIPVPFPLPIPVPVFIPTTRNSAPGIMKEIKKIQDKMPTDPYEAELLMMAEIVAGESKKRDDTDSESDENDIYGDSMDHNSSFNEDLVHMAFKMASGNDYDENPVDLENEMTANTIAPYGSDLDPHSLHQQQMLMLHQQQQRGRKRQVQPTKAQNNRGAANKRIKREEVIQELQPAEKPDAHLCLKYTFGVNAWKQWVTTKNAELEKSTLRRKPFKSEILQLTADELNYSLCLFVKEVRKPNGSEYAPDTIYYLVLGKFVL